MPDSHLEADYEDRNGCAQDDYLDDWDDDEIEDEQ
ncbi:hypothetical protein [Nocardia phage P3.1]|nr:hypothetical protein [Nocardia phage P3.1]